ncbi:MAG: AtpZ/AtpI family protein [Planctomycetes bacterium]|nr:AtpZ/AtpI family protein [Planctomycetota bacterium]
MTDDKNKGFSEVMKYSHLGIAFIITIGIFLTAGYFLDKWLKTSPWIFAFSVFPGLIAGIYLLYKELIAEEDGKSNNS